MADFEALVTAKLGSMGKLKSEIENGLNKTPIEISKFNVNTSDIRSQIEKELSKPFDIKINTGSNSSAANAGKQAAKEFNANFHAVLSDAQRNQAGSILESLGFSSTEAKKETDKLEKIVRDFKIRVTKITQDYKTKATKNGDRSSSLLGVQGYDELGNLVELTRSVDANGFESVTRRIVSSFEQQASSAKTTSSEFSKLEAIQSKINDKKIALAKLDPSRNAEQIKELTNQLSKALTEYQTLFSKIGGSLTKEQNELLAKMVADADSKINEIKAKASDARNVAIDELNSGLGIGKPIAEEFNQVIVSFESIKKGSFELVANVTMLRKAYSEMSDVSLSDEKRIEAQKRYNEFLEKTREEIKRINAEEKSSLNSEILQNKAQTLISKTQKWLKDNPKAAAEFGSQLEIIIEKLKDPSLSGEDFKKLSSEISRSKAEAQELGLVTTPFINNLKQLLGVGSGLAIMQKTISTIKQMAQETIKVDTAMTELYRVTDLSASQYKSLYENMTKSAKAYGAELDTLINSTASWVRLGFDANTANKLAEVSTMYQHVTDLDEKTAVNDLVTAYMGYKDSLMKLTGNDEVAAITRISDVFDKLGRHNCP